MSAQVPRSPTLKSQPVPAARTAKPRRTKTRGNSGEDTHDNLQQSASALVAARHAARHAAIEKEAYLRAERRGFEPGFELDDWLAAEAALNGNGLAASMDDPVGVNSSDSAYGNVL